MGTRIIPNIKREYHKLLCDGLLTFNNFGEQTFHSWFQTLSESDQEKLFDTFVYAIGKINETDLVP